MNNKKWFEKITVIFLFSILLSSLFGTTASADYVYATGGQILSVSNSSSGPFNLVTELVNSSGKVVSSTVSYTDTIFIRIGIAGNYRVKVTCKDSSASKRCKGFGTVSQ